MCSLNTPVSVLEAVPSILSNFRRASFNASDSSSFLASSRNFLRLSCDIDVVTVYYVTPRGALRHFRSRFFENLNFEVDIYLFRILTDKISLPCEDFLSPCHTSTNGR